MTMTVLHPGDCPTIQTAIKKRDGTAMPLTAATVTYRFKKPRNLGVVDKTATIADAPNGIATYHLVTTDIGATELGLWQVETKVVSGSDTFRSVKPIQFKVEAAL